MTRLPNADLAIIDDRKITHYLLALGHPDGPDKATLFRQFGFRPEAANVMRAAFLEHARTAEVVTTRTTKLGTRYIIEGKVRSPDGRDPIVRSVCFVETGEEESRD